MKKFFKILSITSICLCTFTLTAQATPEHQSNLIAEGATQMTAVPDKNTKMDFPSQSPATNSPSEAQSTAIIKSTENQENTPSLKAVILNWQDIPDAVMYELVVKNADTGEKIFSKYNIYATGYQLDSNEVNLRNNLVWQVRGLNINKVPISDYSKPKMIRQGTYFGANWQSANDTCDYNGFSKTDENNYLIEKNANINPLKLTTHFDEMAYMPVYPVYSWIPVKNADHYNIDIFQTKDNDCNNVQKIASYTSSPNNIDYYDKKAYTNKGLYFFHIQAYDKSNHKTAQSKNSYFTVSTDDVKVAALGDSITHGGGAVSTPPSSTLYNWETYAGFPILNIGFSGNLTADMLKRFEHDVLAFKPKILIIMGGVNDIRTGVKADTVIANLTAIKEKCKKNSIIPIFLTVTSINPPKMKSVANLDISTGWQTEREKVNKWIKSQDYYVDVAEEMTDNRGYLADNLTTDGLHPDYEGKKHIGEAVGDYLRLNFDYILY